MGLMDFIKGELIDVIEWTDDSRDTLSFRFPDDDKAIKNGAQLMVRESRRCSSCTSASSATRSVPASTRSRPTTFRS